MLTCCDCAPLVVAERPTNLQLSYKGCYVDTHSRAYEANIPQATMQQCAWIANGFGDSTFGFQGADEAGIGSCYVRDKNLLGMEPFVQVADEECWDAESGWGPMTAFGGNHTYRGASMRNAVYEIEVLDTAS